MALCCANKISYSSVVLCSTDKVSHLFGVLCSADKGVHIARGNCTAYTIIYTVEVHYIGSRRSRIFMFLPHCYLCFYSIRLVKRFPILQFTNIEQVEFSMKEEARDTALMYSVILCIGPPPHPFQGFLPTTSPSLGLPSTNLSSLRASFHLHPLGLPIS